MSRLDGIAGECRRAQAVVDYQAGVPLGKLVEQYGVTREAVSQWLRAAGVPRRRVDTVRVTDRRYRLKAAQALADAGCAAADIAERLGISKTWVWNNGMGYARKAANNAARRAIAERFLAGERPYRIAADLGKTKQGINNILTKELGPAGKPWGRRR